jgi:hypothetical protein
MDKNDGGSVFPGIPNPNAAWNVCAPGMTLRQYYAAKAMQGMCFGNAGMLGDEFSAYAKGPCNSEIVKRSFAMADAMLAFEAQEREG